MSPLARWHAQLAMLGELGMLRPALREWPRFAEYFEAIPTVAKSDDRGLVGVAWFTPWYDAAILGIWVAPRLRRSRGARDFAWFAVGWGFERFPALFAVVASDRRMAQYEKFGFARLARVPRLRDGEDCWLAMLTPGEFEKAKGRYAG